MSTLPTLPDDWHETLARAIQRTETDHYIHQRDFPNMSFRKYRTITNLTTLVNMHRMDETTARRIIAEYQET